MSFFPGSARACCPRADGVAPINAHMIPLSWCNLLSSWALFLTLIHILHLEFRKCVPESGVSHE